MTAFFSTVITVVPHTPLWVWPLYVLLLFLGVQRTRDRTVPLWRELILPVVVIGLAVATLVTSWPGSLLPMLAGLAVGGTGGLLLEPAAATRRLPNGRLWLRGEWLSLAQIVVVLVFRYAINVAPVLDPGLRTDATWTMGTLFVSATLSALFVGRAAARLRIYFAAPLATA